MSKWNTQNEKQKDHHRPRSNFVYFQSHTYTICTYTVPLKCCVYSNSFQLFSFDFFSLCVYLAFFLYLKRYVVWSFKISVEQIVSFSFSTWQCQKGNSLKQHGVKETREKESEKNRRTTSPDSDELKRVSSSKICTVKTLNIVADPCRSLPPCLSAIKDLLPCCIVIIYRGILRQSHNQ